MRICAHGEKRHTRAHADTEIRLAHGEEANIAPAEGDDVTLHVPVFQPSIDYVISEPGHVADWPPSEI